MPHDPTTAADLRSWVESANDPRGDFPIQNLPYCVFHADDGSESHLAVRIGDRLLSLTEANHAGLLENLGFGPDAAEGLQAACEFAAGEFLGSLSPEDRSQLRARVSQLLAAGSEHRPSLEDGCMFDAGGVGYELPVTVSNYTDFYASIHHASTVGSMFRPDNPLLPNYKWVPIGYHGRASTVDVARSPIKRPKGQTKADDAAAPTFGPCAMLDYELEVGCVIASENRQGEPISIADARKHVLGYCLVNDWSARDLQKWEYQPLGPFLAKNFATTISPYIVTPDAVEPFRCAPSPRPAGDPAPLGYLADDEDQRRGSFDLELEVLLCSAEMSKRGMAPVVLSKSRAFRELYWTFSQMIAHHTSNGCSLHAGDLLACGTVSGQEPGTRGCLLELTWDGAGKPRKPIVLPSGEKRTFLADGDTVIMRGRCVREGAVSIGFGECAGTIAL
ncbi:MAG: fumarylacetoacetase [Phycisphaerales bacterium]